MPLVTATHPLGRLAVAAVAAAVLGSAPAGAVAAPSSVSGVDVVLAPGVRVSGRIQDTDGVALQGVTVVICRMHEGIGRCRGAASDSTGAYTVVGLAPADDYVVAVLGTGGDDELLVGWVVDGLASPDISEPPTMAIGPGGLAGYTIRIGRRSGAFAIGGTIRLAALGGAATAASGGRVTVCMVDTGASCSSTTTSADGRYLVRHLAAGSYRVLLLPKEGTNWLQGYAADGPTTVASEKDARTVTVGPGIIDPTDVDGVLAMGRRVMGRILDARGEPVRRGNVRVCEAGGGVCEYGTIRSDGRYVVNGIPPGGMYDLFFSLLTGSTADGRIGPHGYRPEASSGDPFPVDDADVVLPAVRVPDRRLRLAGSVAAADGTPVAGAVVSVFGPGEYVQATTDAGGRYAVRLLAPGRYTVDVQVPETVNLVDGTIGPEGRVAETGAEVRTWQVGTAVTPRVVSRSPRPGATGVAVDAVIRVRYSVPVLGVVDSTVSLWDITAEKSVPGTVSYDATTRAATFRPKRPLVRGHTYNVSLGSPWSVTYTPVAEEGWSFTVGPTPN